MIMRYLIILLDPSETLTKVILDMLKHCSLPRGQTYDGTATCRGKRMELPQE